MRNIRYLSIVLFLVRAATVFANENTLKFNNISSLEGLSNDWVECVIKDNDGYIWIGTENGLNRYNGYEFTIFNEDPSDPSSISSNYVTSLYVDRKGVLWVGTFDKGLNKYDPITETFERFVHDPHNASSISSNYVQAIFQDTEGKHWIGTENGLEKFDVKNQSFSKYLPLGSRSLKNNPVNNIVQTGKYLWLTTWNGGLNKFDLEKELFTSFLPYPEHPNDERNFRMTCLFKDSDNIFWIGGHKDSFIRFDIENEHFLYDNKESILSEITYHANGFCEDDNGKLWITTLGGLYIYKSGANSYERFDNRENTLFDLSANMFFSIFKDNTGIIWVATKGKGVYFYDPNRVKFSEDIIEINHSPKLPNRSFKMAFKDKKGRLWVGTDLGLNLIDPASGKLGFLLMHNPDDSTTLNIGGVCAMLQDSKNRYWVATWGGGLHQFYPNTQTFERFEWEAHSNNPRILSDPNIVCMKQDKEGNIWMSTMSGYLIRFDPNSKIFKNFFYRDYANLKSIFIDEDKKVIWCASRFGLLGFDMQEEKFNQLLWDQKEDHTISNTHVTGLVGEKNGNIWLSTLQGLKNYNPSTGKFTSYFANDGLMSDHLLSIQIDIQHNIWVSSDKGLSKFDPVLKTFLNFNELNGALVNSEYSYLSPEGRLFFGGINGVNAFFPHDIKINPATSSVVFTDIKVFNKSIQLKEGSVNFAKNISLNHKQAIFSISFAALNFTHPEKNMYAYSLVRNQSSDPSWNMLGSKREVVFNNLKPGRYNFMVKAANNDGLWSDEYRSIMINVLPPFWQTLWFKIVAVLLLFGTIVGWNIIKTHSLRAHKNELEKKVKERTTELEQQKEEIKEMAIKLHEVDVKKIRFLVNISHEFRTPLTLITNPLEKILKEFSNDPQLTEQLGLVHNNAKRLLFLTNQMLDMRKLESGDMELEVTEMDIVKFLKEVFDSFVKLLTDYDITFTYKHETEILLTWFDADKLEKIMVNLISNAFKFTRSGGEVTLRLSDVRKLRKEASEIDIDALMKNGFKGDEYISIQVEDTGIGISSEQLPNIYDRFFQAETIRSKPIGGTGIGLNLVRELVILHHGSIHVQSEVGKGSIFTLILPVSKNQFKETELRNTEADFVVSSDYPLLQNVDHKRIIEPKVKEKITVKPTVLLVEDNVELQHYIIESLWQYRIKTAENGKTGIQTAFREMPDLIICDVMMPEMNGYELCEKLKSDFRTSHIPIIMLTAKADDDSQLECLKYGADDFIIKPFKIEILEARIYNLIMSRKKLQAKFNNNFDLEVADPSIQSFDEKFIKKASEVVDEGLSIPEFDVSVFAQKVGMSRAQIYRKFSAIMNQSPNDFIFQRRMNKARQLLASNQYSVSEVAYQVGFKYPSHFTKCYKNAFGISPSEYLKTKRNNQNH